MFLEEGFVWIVMDSFPLTHILPRTFGLPGISLQNFKSLGNNPVFCKNKYIFKNFNSKENKYSKKWINNEFLVLNLIKHCPSQNVLKIISLLFVGFSLKFAYVDLQYQVVCIEFYYQLLLPSLQNLSAMLYFVKLYYIYMLNIAICSCMKVQSIHKYSESHHSEVIKGLKV
jgi:hypothetical protein